MENLTEKFLTAAPQWVSMRAIDFPNIYSQKEHIPSKHELLYVLDGRVKLHLKNNLVFEAKPGDFLLVPEKTPHRDEFATLKGLRILIVYFRWDAGDYFAKVNNRSLMNLSYEVRSEVRRRLEFMRTHIVETPQDAINASIQLHSILLLFYFDLIRNEKCNAAAGTLPAEEAVKRAKHFIDQNFAASVTLKNTAEHIGISPSYLSRMFHHEYGVSFNQYLNTVRLEEARKLLQSTFFQIGEIAAKCGFSSSSYFIKVFSQYYKITPKNYILQANKNAGK